MVCAYVSFATEPQAGAAALLAGIADAGSHGVLAEPVLHQTGLLRPRVLAALLPQQPRLYTSGLC